MVKSTHRRWVLAVCLCTVGMVVGTLRAQNGGVDPGPRGGVPSAGGFAGSSPDEAAFFSAARDRFSTIFSVSGSVDGEEGVGLGPTFNGNSCAMCHREPDTGGSSPGLLGFSRQPNPQVAMAVLDRLPARDNVVPPFITNDGPVREARFIALSSQRFARLDGSVHDLYTIAGRVDAPACGLAQPNFVQALANNNVVFRIPTPLFGLGLVENTPDLALQMNLAADGAAKTALGIRGTLNTDDTGAVMRFGWKAQSKSLLTAAAEAANVELGLTSEGAPNKRLAVAECALNPLPEDATHINNPFGAGSLTGSASEMSSDVVNFAMFARLLAPPNPTTASPSEVNGRNLFTTIGCALCHSTQLTSGPSRFTNQSNRAYHPYSDFALHHMGATLADGVVQGLAGPDMFRTAPLWGVGQRLFFLHDGRTSNLVDAIRAHFSPAIACTASESFSVFQANGTWFQPFTSTHSCGSEANGVVATFNALGATEQQDLLNFLRSL